MRGVSEKKKCVPACVRDHSAGAAVVVEVVVGVQVVVVVVADPHAPAQ